MIPKREFRRRIHRSVAAAGGITVGGHSKWKTENPKRESLRSGSEMMGGGMEGGMIESALPRRCIGCIYIIYTRSTYVYI